MKFCQKCGAQADDNVVFCTNCGERFTSNQPPMYNQVEPNYYQGQAPRPKPTLSQNPVLNKVKGLATAPLFLVTIIIFSLSVFLQFIRAFKPGSVMGQLFEGNKLLQEIGGLDFFGSTLYRMQGVFTAYALIALVPTILICIGLWMFYASAATPENRSTAGLTMIKVSVIINF